MELKQKTLHLRFRSDFLLIEPYGIETWSQVRALPPLRCLLIEPYGIETTISTTLGFRLLKLLIEPYGIETSYGGVNAVDQLFF